MNKQQLASRIWESANKMRSKIEANEYKDYILGFIFYKFLSDKEVAFLKKRGMSDAELRNLSETDLPTVDFCKSNLGYFIAWRNLFSTWLERDAAKTFDIADVSTALSAFDRLISDPHKKVFEKIFDTLQLGLQKLGDTSGAQTKAVAGLLNLIKDIPMDGRQDYDVLGFIYEYLIGNFAANAGKKAGEFYTPHEVSVLMSEIIADHLRDRSRIEIYDPTSGSGSLLINIGRSVAKHMADRNKIKYFAQELKANTWNLTRMNLVMRGILPDNIETRNADTLEEDWPISDETAAGGGFKPLRVDAVVSNPPYSQNWLPDESKRSDPRFEYGLAPKSKADYAFLLHDLYHLKPHGIMTIVLPHGVLFRGDEEGEIRRNLVEGNNISAIIGLPPDIFFGTGIPTIVMVLKKDGRDDGILFVDASQGFVKQGKKNKLRASDIRRIADTVAARPAEIPKFARLVSRDEIRANGYNLNIPRYVDSSGDPESWDLFATMKGGVPNAELDSFQDEWEVFEGLREAVFKTDGSPYSALAADDIAAVACAHPSVRAFGKRFETALAGFSAWLENRLVEHFGDVDLPKEERILSDEIFRRLEDVPLVNPYAAYQHLDDMWLVASNDLEILQEEGFGAVRKVDPNMVVKKKDGKDQEVQDGWAGRIIPFDLVQRTLLKSETEAIAGKEAALGDIQVELSATIEALDDDDKEKYLNDDNTAFNAKAVAEAVDAMYLARFPKGKVKKADRLDHLRHALEEEQSSQTADTAGGNAPPSTELLLIQAQGLLLREKEMKKEIKELSAALHLATKAAIEQLSEEDARMLLRAKWIDPFLANLLAIPDGIVDALCASLKSLVAKYSETFDSVEEKTRTAEANLAAMLDDLHGNTCDNAALAALKAAVSPAAAGPCAPPCPPTSACAAGKGHAP